MEDLYDPEELILCPYDKSHHIRRCKMSFHLVKCKVNHGEQKRVPCDFNATHMIAEPELQYHHQICPDRRKIEACILDSRKRTENKFPIPKIEVPSEENWDDCNVPTYDPTEYAMNNNVLRQLDVASSAKKRNFRLEERQRLSELSRRNKEMQTDGAHSQEKARGSVNLPPHRTVTNFTEDTSSRSQLKEKLKMGANKVFLQFDGN